MCVAMEEVLDVSGTNWTEQISRSAVLTVVYFWHDKCPWCRQLSPIFNEIAEEFKGEIKFLKLNILENQANQELANNYGIMSTPTLLFLCKGRPVGQIVGFASKEDLERGLNDIHGRYRQCLNQSTELRPTYIV
jgi:thioredoxin 1